MLRAAITALAVLFPLSISAEVRPIPITGWCSPNMSDFEEGLGPLTVTDVTKTNARGFAMITAENDKHKVVFMAKVDEGMFCALWDLDKDPSA